MRLEEAWRAVRSRSMVWDGWRSQEVEGRGSEGEEGEEGEARQSIGSRSPRSWSAEGLAPSFFRPAW